MKYYLILIAVQFALATQITQKPHLYGATKFRAFNPSPLPTAPHVRTSVRRVQRVAAANYDHEENSIETPLSGPLEHLSLPAEREFPRDRRFRNVPTYEELKFTGIDQITRNGYAYALDTVSPLYHAAVPGYLKVTSPAILAHELQRFFIDAFYGNNGEIACESLNRLFEIDGLVKMHSLTIEDLKAPKDHYMAVIIEDRDPTSYFNRDYIYDVMYYRFNHGGVISTKPGIAPVERVPHPTFHTADNVIDFLSTLSFERPRFCGFYQVSEKTKSFLNKTGGRPRKH